MGRKAYIADVAAASTEQIPGIISVAKGSEDGEVHLCYVASKGAPIEISLISLEVGGYPSENMYMITTESMDLPDGVNDVLQNIQETSAGMRIQDLLATISQKLERHFSAGTREHRAEIGSASDMEVDEGADNEDSYSEAFPESDDEDWTQGPSKGSRNITKLKLSPESAARINRRIRADLRAVKRAGFRIGILDGAKAESVSTMLSMSVKVDKLGLSEEAIQAWDLEPQQYIILLARYTDGYKPFEDIISEAVQNLSVEYRIGVGKKYKPTLVEALAAFSESKKYDRNSSNTGGTQELKEESPAGFGSLFISSSLNEFINKSLIPLVKIRNNVGVGWSGAKSWYNRKQSRMDNAESDLPDALHQEDAIDNQKSLPDMISCDHLIDHGDEQISFPLLAAQFALRYLVRCTEYCLVCHDKLGDEFEALKPYVCDKPLCLYQYMSLGFGPSIEHEILTQPYVVDLLTSFCYASAYNQRIRDYPTGMALLVPPVMFHVTNPTISRYSGHYPNRTSTAVDVKSLDKSVEVKFDPISKEITFDNQAYDKSPVNVGEWVVIVTPERLLEHHRVHEIAFFPTVRLSKEPVTLMNSDANATVPTPATTPPPQNIVKATMVPYSENFDDMDKEPMAETIVALLDTLPSIKEMRSYLLRQSRSSEPNLRAWNDRISPAALGILRWIVASNRSCIVQVDKCPGQEELDLDMSKVRLDQRIAHIGSSYVQFRFAQGSPDKEQRFLNALKAQQANLNNAYPTIFAWHGSNLANWHSIIRSGLDFKETLNGRAYGHGVYHARDQQTSIGYAAPNQLFWPGSSLKITSAMSLNEIVNCPAQFASNNPFLVVQHIDWIQCRYLLVQVAAVGSDSLAPYHDTTASINEARAEDIPQDPSYKATSTLSKNIGVPSCAITTSKSFRADKHKFLSLPMKKKQKRSKASEDLSLMVVSDSDEMEDIAFLLSDDENSKAGGGALTKSPQAPLTDFVPGSLDQSTLPMLDEPSYTTPMATRTLQRNLKEVLDIQKKTPLHELGWYINAELISNMYQWIVELHSFDQSTPLAKDMKASGITSVVLEIRFGKDYPHSPPFVRVIRPRFLPFMNGGGGHVTAGGAMCMELLTNSGWSAVSSIESVLLQVRMAMMNLEPRPARLESKGMSRSQHDYGVYEAIEAYKRACAQHGWQVPKDFGDFANAQPSNGGSSMGFR